MKKLETTPGAMSSARKKLYRFTFFNIISFTLLSGNTITLFALRLGADSLLIGILSFFTYISYLCMPIGKSLVPKYGIVGLMGKFWFLRHLMMLPILFTPLAVIREIPLAVYGLIVFSVLGFYVFRGIAITGYNPVIGEIVEENERGAFLSRLQKIHHAVTLVVSIVMALLLGREAPLFRYSAFILFGIICGTYASSVFIKIPEPGRATDTKSGNLWLSFTKAYKRKPFKRFITCHFLISLTSFMITPFLIVYIKKVYAQPDNFVLFFTVFGSLGAIIMALVSGLMIDRLGAKPLYFIFTCIIALAIIPTILSPDMKTQHAIWIFSAAVFFFHHMGSHGVLNSGQTYFFAAITAEERLDLGIVFFLTRGLGSGMGSLAGGFILHWLQHYLGLSSVDVFRIYFGFLAVFILVIIFLINRMETLGAHSIRNVLAAIISPREIRTISLLNRLDKFQTISEEKRTIRALAASKSELSVNDILLKLRSPRFTIRKEALTALSTLPVDKTVTDSLISEVKDHTFTTAYLAADIIGKRNIYEGIPVLRRQLHSEDIFLSGKCMVSLARLNDRKSLSVIEDIVRKTDNARLIVHGAVALEIFKDPYSIAILLSKLTEKTQHYMKDEIILSLSNILGFGEWFYPIYVSFLKKNSVGISHLKDFINERGVEPRLSDEISKLSKSLETGDWVQFVNLSEQLLKQIDVICNDVNCSTTFRKALKDKNVTRLNRFCFLTAALIFWFTAVKKRAR
jgi:MFS family permease